MSFVFRYRARVFSPLLVVLSALGGCAYVTPEQPRAPALPVLAKPAPFTAADAEFVQTLNTMDLAQIALAKSATTQAGRSDIALLGATIAKDMAAVQARLAKVATAHTLSLTDKPAPAGKSGLHGCNARMVLCLTGATSGILPVRMRG